MAINDLGAVFATSGYRDVYSDIYGTTLFTATLSAGELRVTAIEVVGYYSTAVSLGATITGGSTVSASFGQPSFNRLNATITGAGTFSAEIQEQGATFDADVRLLVEAAFTATPFDATPAWTDITTKVRNLTVARGRQHELDRIEAGTLTLLLDNRDRRFDPTYTSSPYYPNLLPMVKVRVSAIHNGTTYRVFVGYVDGWPQEWPGGGLDAVTEVTATDGFKILAATEWPSAINAEILNDTPRGYWPLTDSESATWDDLSNNNYAGTSKNVTIGEGLLSENAAVFDPTTTAGPEIRFPAGTAITGTGAFTVEAWINIEEYPALEGYVYAQRGVADFTGQLLIPITDTGKVRFFTGTVGGVSTLSNRALELDRWYHIVCTRDGSGVQRIYINGQLDKIGTPTAICDLDANPTMLGALISGESRDRWFDGSMCHVATYDSALASGRVLAHYLAGINGWEKDLTGARLGRLLTVSGWPTAERSLSTGQTRHPSLSGTVNSFDAIRDAVKADNGNAYVSKSGVFVFRDRHWAYKNATTSQATFGESNVPYNSLSVGYDDDRIINRATVKSDPKNGFYQDATTVTKYTPHTHSETLELYDGNDAPARAQYLVGRYKNPIIRVKNIALRPQRNPSVMWPQVLGREIGDRVTISRTPPAGGTAITDDVYVERIEHYVSQELWETRFEMSPTDDTQYWILGDATDGKLGSTTRLGY